MMRRAALASLLLPALGAATADAQIGVRTFTDTIGDASHRTTDIGAARAFYDLALPDILEVRVSAWDAPSAQANPFMGAPMNPAQAHIFRIDSVFNGLVNPPGGLGLGFSTFEPDKFGPRPLYGFLEIDNNPAHADNRIMPRSGRNSLIQLTAGLDLAA